ncbi:MAG: hypothetical protein MRJ65_04640 [Candidatus Brocadiaceae bacterium]|nr:hypothetical protein [Candidatus Brocadiaceae bacterium]
MKARASSQGDVRRKPETKLRADLSACGRTGRRTETSYKADHSGVSQHSMTKPCSSGEAVHEGDAGNG